MARPMVLSLTLLAALGVAIQPADARDPKTSSGGERHAAELMVARAGRAMAGHASFASSSASEELPARDDALAKHHVAVPPDEHKTLTLFRFDSKFGEISVQPVVGSVKGAQLSIGF